VSTSFKHCKVDDLSNIRTSAEKISGAVIGTWASGMRSTKATSELSRSPHYEVKFTRPKIFRSRDKKWV